MPELILALDIGTSAVSAGVFSPAGQLVGQAGAPITSTSAQPGRVEQDAAAVWTSVRGVIDAVLAKAGIAANDLAAVGITSQRASIVCWDRTTGEPLAPMVVWSDLRGAARAMELQQAGFMVMPQTAAAKLEGVVAALPDRSNMAWGNIDAFVTWKLSGGAVHATDRSQGWPMGYLDLATFGWNEALIAHQGLDPASFPRLVDTWGVMGVTAKAVLGAEVPIAAVVADQQAALIAHGCEAPGECKASYGTSAMLDVSTGGQFMFAGPTTPPFVLSSVGGDTRFCLEGMVYAAGSALDWLRRTCGLGDHAAFEALAEAAPDAEGAWFLPALQGLGSPHGDFSRRAALGGLSMATDRSHLARAGIEGVAGRIREVFDYIYAGTGLPRPDRLRADGGLTNSAQFMQAQADMLGLPVARHAIREATACGAAICAGKGVGLLSDASAFVRYDRTFEPRTSPEEAQAKFSAWMDRAHGKH